MLAFLSQRFFMLIHSFSKYSLSFYFVLGTKLYLIKSISYNDYY